MLDETPIDPHLLPECSSVGRDGELHLGHGSASELVAEYGSPLFVYDLDEIRDNFFDAYGEFGDGIAYATKAFLSGDIVALAYDAGLSLDVSTDGEYEMVRASGFPADRIVLHGNNKSPWLIDAAVRDGVQWLVIDNWDDIDLTRETCRAYGTTARVVLRVNPGIEVHTHEFCATGNRHSKFGLPIWTGDAQRALDLIHHTKEFDFRGIHTHIGSLVYSLSNFERGLEALQETIASSGTDLVIVGGGLGVRYLNADEAPTFAAWAKTIKATLQRIGFEGKVLAEPGRSVVARSGITIYTVGTVRDMGDLVLVAVDGGMSDNPRPMLYGSGYEAFLCDAVEHGRPVPTRLVGSHCESGDTLVTKGSLQRRPVRGNLVATPVTGAYGYSMASHYNRMCRPAVVYVSAGEARLGIARDSFEDLRRNDTYFSLSEEPVTSSGSTPLGPACRHHAS
jgi:diaminopimelate decarboxylase